MAGRLRCGFCGDVMDVHWYPGSQDQDMTRNLASLHFSACPARGDVWVVELFVFDGDKREHIALALFRPATYIAVDVPARLGFSRHSVDFFADVDGRRVTNRMAQEEVEFLEQDFREGHGHEPEVLLAIFERSKAEMHRIAAWKIEIGERNETGGADVFLLDRDRFAEHR